MDKDSPDISDRFDRYPKSLLCEARKTQEAAVNSWFLFGGRHVTSIPANVIFLTLICRTEHWKCAAETYDRAANGFRLRQKYIEAGKAFEQSANIQRLKLNKPTDAANTLVEAFQCYRRHKPEDAVHCLGLAIQQLARSGLMKRAATCQQMMAECYELELREPQKAIEAYELAIDWFKRGNADA
ncbi:vesicular-fusion protein S17 [Cadophora gregata f. sp. sojae]|nr:vesicular-fusion protein S17 [Cadophora gregata f. sp. sojae]